MTSPDSSALGSRRDFFRQATALSLAATGPAFRGQPSETMRVAVAGIRSRGRQLLEGFRALANVQVVAVCDADRAFLDRERAAFAKRGEKLDIETDIRRLLDRKDIDAIVIASPNHWHALMGIWACQAGKDVYVEKPISHGVWEGRQLVRAARHYGRIVQTGTQIRSSHGIADAIAWLRGGALGEIKLARGLCYKPRKSIGRISAPPKLPKTLDYDLWCGPAAKQPLGRRQLHYDWHWVWNTGNGDLGNQGIHQIDICRWALGDPGLPSSVTSVGGRLGYRDDGETPNTQIARFEFAQGVPIIFEVRGLPRDLAAQKGPWEMDRHFGTRIGAIIHAEKGRLVIPSYSSAIAYDEEGREIRRFRGSRNHIANFVEAVRRRDRGHLAADIEQGHLSSAICHLSGIAHHRGIDATGADVARALGSDEDFSEAFRRMRGHLEANGVDLDRAKLKLSSRLILDERAERFRDDGKANALLRREYRSPFVVPERF
jgi:predicted dehydrogenase